MEVAVNPQQQYPDTMLDDWQFSVAESAEYGFYPQKQLSAPLVDQNQISNPIVTIRKYFNEFVVWDMLKDKGIEDSPKFCISNIFIFENTIENEDCSGAEFIETKDYREQFTLISRFFRYSKSEWAKIFSVSRVSIYDWLSGKTTPTGENARKISSIYKLLGTLANTSIPISCKYLYQNISKYNKSVLDIFLTSKDIMREYEDLPDTLAALVQRSKNTHDRLSKLAKSRKPKDTTLDYNLQKLQF